MSDMCACETKDTQEEQGEEVLHFIEEEGPVEFDRIVEQCGDGAAEKLRELIDRSKVGITLDWRYETWGGASD